MFRMNVPGVYFNNRNWPHVLNALRTWACLTLASWIPFCFLVRWGASLVLPEGKPVIAAMVLFCLLEILGGLFIPVVVVGKKFE